MTGSFHIKMIVIKITNYRMREFSLKNVTETRAFLEGRGIVFFKQGGGVALPYCPAQ
jgi:hypothetical protein